VCEFIMFEYVSRNKLLSLCLENLTRLAGLTRVTRLTGFAGYTEIYIMVSGWIKKSIIHCSIQEATLFQQKEDCGFVFKLESIKCITID